MSNMSLEEQIRLACIHADVSMAELAKRFGISASGLTQRLATGKFKKEELEKIASILNCTYKCEFRFDDGTVF